MSAFFTFRLFAAVVPIAALAVACVDSAPTVEATSQDVQALKYPNTTLCGVVSAKGGHFVISRSSEPFLMSTKVDTGDVGPSAQLEFGTTPEDGASLHLLEDLAGKRTCLSGDFNGGSLQVVSAAQIHPSLPSEYEKCGIVRATASGALSLEFSQGLALALSPQDGSSLTTLSESYLGKAACIRANWSATAAGLEGAAVASAGKISKPRAAL
jgi:hypothetical protein